MKTCVPFVLVAATLVPSGLLAAPRIVVSVESTSVVRDDQARTWAIGNNLIRLVTSIDSKQEYKLARLEDPATGRKWTRTEEADTALSIAGSKISLGPPGAFQYETYHALELNAGVELRVVFQHSGKRVRAVRHYAVYRDAPVIEMWTTLEALPGAASVQVADLNAFQMVFEPGAVRWVNGLEVAEAEGGPFGLRRRELSHPERFEIGATGRSSAIAIPWFSIENQAGTVFGGIMWSGAWLLRVDALTAGFRASMGLGSMSTRLDSGRTLEGPHGFVGIASKEAGAVSSGMRAFVEEGIRRGRPFLPRVTFNTWYGHGVRIDEATILREMELAASLGAERFVIDAGWAQGSGALGDLDFTSGLGRFTADPERFPSGLAALSARAHELGLEFGLWVEPERVDLETVYYDEAVDERWLVRRQGILHPGVSDEESRAGMLCLGDEQARQWLLARLTRLIEESGIDYLKWDNNDWVNCDRPDHGHGQADGNFSHVAGFYEILAALRERFPDLVIENCAAGARRFDFGIMRYTDTAWMDDRTSPSALVRRNLSRLGEIFPPAYLLSFIVEAEEEPLHEAADLRLLLRSRMPGAFGVSFSETLALDEAERALIAAEIGAHKSIAGFQARALSIALDGGDGWEVTEELTADASAAVLFAFQVDGEAGRMVLRPVGLHPDATYEVRSADTGVLGTASGTRLMESGIEIEAWGQSAAHVLVLSVVEGSGEEGENGKHDAGRQVAQAF